MKRMIWFWLAALAASIWVPMPLLFATLIVFSSGVSKKWLVPLAAISELLTALPIGILTGVVVAPYLARRFFVRGEIESKVSLFFLLLAITAFQYLLLASVDLTQGVLREGFREISRYIPWWGLLAGVVSVSCLAFALLFMRANVSPISLRHEGRHSY